MSKDEIEFRALGIFMSGISSNHPGWMDLMSRMDVLRQRIKEEKLKNGNKQEDDTR